MNEHEGGDGAGTGVGTRTRIERNVAGRESLVTFEVVIERDRKM